MTNHPVESVSYTKREYEVGDVVCQVGIIEDSSDFGTIVAINQMTYDVRRDDGTLFHPFKGWIELYEGKPVTVFSKLKPDNDGVINPFRDIEK